MAVERDIRCEVTCSTNRIDQPVRSPANGRSTAFFADDRIFRAPRSNTSRIASSHAMSVAVTRSIPPFDVISAAPARESASRWAVFAARMATSVSCLTGILPLTSNIEFMSVDDNQQHGYSDFVPHGVDYHDGLSIRRRDYPFRRGLNGWEPPAVEPI
jgi:hypothetical protein